MADPADEAAVRTGAAIGSISPRAQIAVAGSDRATYLQGLLTNDIQALAEGSGCYAAWLTPQGRMLTDMHVLQSAAMILLDVPAAQADATLARLDQFLFSEDVRIESLAEAMTGVWVHGPAARRRSLERSRSRLQPDVLADWLDYQHTTATFEGEPVSVARIDQLGVPGYCVFLARATEERFVAAAVSAGARVVAPDALHAARIEAGYPLFGIDMTDDTIPLEAGIEQRAISFSKGCFVGQEVVIRVLHRGGGRVAKRLVGFKLTTTADGAERRAPCQGCQSVFRGAGYRFPDKRRGLADARPDRARIRSPGFHDGRDRSTGGRASRDSGRIADGVRLPASQPHRFRPDSLALLQIRSRSGVSQPIFGYRPPNQVIPGHAHRAWRNDIWR